MSGRHPQTDQSHRPTDKAPSIAGYEGRRDDVHLPPTDPAAARRVMDDVHRLVHHTQHENTNNIVGQNWQNPEKKRL